jgi:hypothetical protein
MVAEDRVRVDPPAVLFTRFGQRTLERQGRAWRLEDITLVSRLALRQPLDVKRLHLGAAPRPHDICDAATRTHEPGSCADRVPHERWEASEELPAAPDTIISWRGLKIGVRVVWFQLTIPPRPDTLPGELRSNTPELRLTLRGGAAPISSVVIKRRGVGRVARSHGNTP